MWSLIFGINSSSRRKFIQLLTKLPPPEVPKFHIRIAKITRLVSFLIHFSMTIPSQTVYPRSVFIRPSDLGTGNLSVICQVK